MGFSSTDIANRALQMIGGQAINSLSDNSKNAKECAKCYDTLRLALLESHPWNFASVFASLAKLALPDTVPPAGSMWDGMQAYELPADYVRLLCVSASGSWLWLWNNANYAPNQDFINQDGILFSWLSPPLNIRYVRDYTNTDTMSPLFREALANLMAVEMCEMLTQSNTKKAALVQSMAGKIFEARRANAFVKPPATSGDDDWVLVRR